jgi:hypothetical protein|eukprot:COSAG01_NODE_6831_length_3480_cov_314.546584_2_plen_67_part_00
MSHLVLSRNIEDGNARAGAAAAAAGAAAAAARDHGGSSSKRLAPVAQALEGLPWQLALRGSGRSKL